MKKNLLLLNQKKYLSFLNYKKLINQSKKTENKFKLILSTESNSSNHNLKQNPPNKLKIINNDQILAHRNSSNLFKESKSLKAFSLYKIIPSIKITKNIYLQKEIIKENRIVKYMNKKNKDIKTELIKELFKDNKCKKLINKRCVNFFEYKNIFNKNSLRCSMNCMNCYFHFHKRYESFCLAQNKREINDNNNKLLKSQNQCISSRKINKDSFVNGIHKILKEQRGKKKIKYKIIGALKTEPNYI